ncbi:uncharacterized protein LOC134728232 [Mytilus trossulus]|uniref:uncharacterized protein LOC134728232 n=1 Tax=Mytilus trossulus TaxID=6551 RepID=UPI003006939F
MASANSDRVCIHNWRVLCHGKSKQGNGRHGSIYRSSRPDLMDPLDLEEFKKHGIKCIIDLRSDKDYEIASGSKVLDNYYKLYKVVLPKSNCYKQQEPVICQAIEGKKKKKAKGPATEILEKKHFLINFFTSAYTSTLFKRAPWYIQLISLFIAIFDFIFRTGFKNFVRLFAVTVINRAGIAASYLDIAEMSKGGICAGLKLLTDKNNMPAMINCAHGKDRTGILSAMVLSVLGETEENIITDYALSQEGLLPIRDRVFKEVVEKYYWDKSFCDANPENMRMLLNYLNKTYGSVKDYLVSIGFSEEEQEILRKNLLEHE